MGFLKKVFRPVRKIAKKIIPKEIRPFLPYIAATIPGAQGLASLSFMNPAAQKALFAGLTSAATDEQGDPLRAAALAAAPDVLSSGLGKIAGKFPMTEADETLTFAQKIGEGARRGQDFIERQGAIKTIGAQTAIDQSAKLAEIQQDEIDKYNEELRKQGVLDKTKRRTSILNIYLNAGYEPDYVNSMLDRYGYDEGGIVKALKALRAKMKAPETVAKQMSDRLRRKPTDDDNDDDMVIPPKKPKKDDDEDEKPVPVTTEGDLASGLQAAARGVEQAFGRGFGEMEPMPMLRFARGGEVEIEEQVDDLGIMDFMKDQGVPYGEMASNMENDKILEQLFEKYLDMGLSPKDAEKAAFDEFERMSQKPDEGIMQMASGYKTDIEEMYEQYVFEMEEMGLQPMSFAQFVAQARAGMKDGGKVRRRKKGEPMDDDGEKPGPSLFPKVPKGEFFLDKMPKPKRREGILKAANGGSPGSRYSFLINKQKQGILSPDEEEELLMLEITFADESQGKADGGIMEKDMRGGGFIPEGSKERADDVPARLSKNEFVMTADAVRAAGGGSINKGAKRMYDMMYSLEGKV